MSATNRSEGRKVKIKAILVLCLGTALLAVGTALATAPSMAVGELLARGTLADGFGDKLKLATGLFRSGLRSSTDIAVQKVTIQPGGNTGWHTHPGPTLVIVKTGALTFYETDCTSRTYSAGQAFVDQGGGHVHLASNKLPATTVTELWATYIVPGAPGSPFRIDAPAPPGCTPA